MSWKKLFFIFGIFLFIFLLPVILCSTPVLELFQGMVDENPQGSMAPWAQITIADIYYFTGRTKQARDAYTKFMDHYPTDERYPAAVFNYAASLDELRKIPEAMAAYEVFIEKFPNHPDTRKAQEAIARLRVTK